MNRQLSILLLSGLVLVGGCAGPATRSGTAVDDGRVQVNYENPSEFTDVREKYQEPTTQYYLDTLRKEIVEKAGLRLASGQRLSITFLDIDVAGDFEPWRPQLNDVRLVKPIYPPRMKFTWVLTGSNGDIVREGREDLVDLNFSIRQGFNINLDPLFYEKQLITDWIRRTLP